MGTKILTGQDSFLKMKFPISVQDGRGIPEYNLFILLGILSVVVIIMGKKLKKS